MISLVAAALCGSPAVFAESYSVFRVCEDQHVLRTSDGAEAGHVEYIVVEPSQQRIVSTVITGGVIGENTSPFRFPKSVSARSEKLLYPRLRVNVWSAHR